MIPKLDWEIFKSTTAGGDLQERVNIKSQLISLIKEPNNIKTGQSNEIWQNWEQAYKNILKHIPIKPAQQYKPYITEDIIQIIERRNAAFLNNDIDQ